MAATALDSFLSNHFVSGISAYNAGATGTHERLTGHACVTRLDVVMADSNPNSKQLSRRDFLKLGISTSLGLTRFARGLTLASTATPALTGVPSPTDLPRSGITPSVLPTPTPKFPPDFLWGSATAAHQVEGANANSDWWDWEQVPGHIKNDDKSAVACDWWKGERYRGDFDLARSLNQNAHRLSIEWSRIEPREGEWSAEAIAFYRRVLTALRERGIMPLVTLHHFTNPRWLVQKSAWETSAVVPLFERYATKIVQELGDLCDFWVTVNEPVVYIYKGYNEGNWPPGKKDFFLAFRVLANLVRGHTAAYHAIHRVQPNARVGVAHHLRRFIPADPGATLDQWAVNLRDHLFNRLFFLALVDGALRFPMSIGETIPEAVGTQDFIGVNYYFAERVTFDVTQPMLLFTRSILKPWPVQVPSIAADVEPTSLYDFLSELARYEKPIYITENGIFDLGDETQPRYLVAHLVQTLRAIDAGIPLKGYFYWTLVDNFEWSEGYSARFGLFANDLHAQSRTPRASAEVYSRIARENDIVDDLVERYGR